MKAGTNSEALCRIIDFVLGEDPANEASSTFTPTSTSDSLSHIGIRHNDNSNVHNGISMEHGYQHQTHSICPNQHDQTPHPQGGFRSQAPSPPVPRLTHIEDHYTLLDVEPPKGTRYFLLNAKLETRTLWVDAAEAKEQGQHF